MSAKNLIPLTPRRKRLLWIYAAALAASGIARRVQPLPRLPPEMRSAELRVADHGAIGSRRIRLAYRDTGSDRPPVVFIHGSPGSSRVFDKLTAILAPHFRVIAPDLPGFGYSTRDIPDYSFRAHARYLQELLDALRIRSAPFVGFSMGGGVVLSLADIAPERVASITMLSAIGVQEQELLGGYHANHFLHGAQLAALWALREAVPHFGLLERLPLNVEYARNFYDSDQRPLRSILMRYRGRMLILHGANDWHVPVAAAREHHRLVPQSELEIVDGDHFLLFQDPEVFRAPLLRFLVCGAGC